MKALLLFFLLVTGISIQAQVAVNTDGTAPDNSAMLDVKSSTKGILAPRMTLAQRNTIINPATGLLIFQTDAGPGLYFNSGTPAVPVWALVGFNAGQWLSNGSSIYYSLGKVGIGISSPGANFQVAENGPGFTGSFGTPVNAYVSGTNVAIGDDNADAVLYVGQSTYNKGFVLWRYHSILTDAFFSVGTYDGLNNLILQEIGGKVGVRTTSPAALFHVAEESPGYTGLFGTPISTWNSSTNISIGDPDGPSVLYIGQSAANKGFLFWQNSSTPENAYYNIGTFDGLNPLVLQQAGGNVGIGVTYPVARFQVAESGSSYTGLFGTPISSYTTGTNLSIGDDNANSLLYVGQSNSNKGFLIWNYDPTVSNAFFGVGTYSGNNPLILQHAGGNVGIGTTMPATRLDVRYDVNGFSQLGYNVSNPSYFYHNELAVNGDGQTALYAFRTRPAQNDGTYYAYNTSNAALKGYSLWGDLYSFGTTGFNYNDYTRCGGVLGAQHLGDYWGSLGYKSSGNSAYGGYFTSYTSGAGKSVQANTGIGIGAWGDLMGADIHGKVYGIYAEGENYAMFSNGDVYKNKLDIHLQDNGTGTNTVLYTNVSTDVTVQTIGVATLSNGRASIAFDQSFAAAVSSESPVIVTVTPIGNSNGVYLAEVSGSGFTVVENNAGKSNITVNYIAIGKRAGYEHPGIAREVIDATYTGNIARGLHNDADTRTNGEGLYYENGQLTVGIHPSTLPDPNKPLEKTEITTQGEISGNQYNSVGIGNPEPVQPQMAVTGKSSVASPAGGTGVPDQSNQKDTGQFRYPETESSTGGPLKTQSVKPAVPKVENNRVGSASQKESQTVNPALVK